MTNEANGEKVDVKQFPCGACEHVSKTVKGRFSVATSARGQSQQRREVERRLLALGFVLLPGRNSSHRYYVGHGIKLTVFSVEVTSISRTAWPLLTLRRGRIGAP